MESIEDFIIRNFEVASSDLNTTIDELERMIPFERDIIMALWLEKKEET